MADTRAPDRDTKAAGAVREGNVTGDCFVYAQAKGVAEEMDEAHAKWDGVVEECGAEVFAWVRLFKSFAELDTFHLFDEGR